MPTVDAEVGTSLLFPVNAAADDAGLIVEKTSNAGIVLKACRPGIVRVSVPGTSRAVFVRIARHEFVGLAQYRHLECEEEGGDE